MKPIAKKEFERNEKLERLAEYIEGGHHPFDIFEPRFCFYGQALKVFGGRYRKYDPDRVEHLAKMLKINLLSAFDLYADFEVTARKGAAKTLRKMQTPAGVRKRILEAA